MVAVGMRGLHKLGIIIHKDMIKASNVLVDSTSPCLNQPLKISWNDHKSNHLETKKIQPRSEDFLQRGQIQSTGNKQAKAGVDGKFECLLSDSECSSEIVRTRFSRAPDILLALKQQRNDHVNAKLAFTQEADVYS
jgi:hypothetical protein